MSDTRLAAAMRRQKISTMKELADRLGVHHTTVGRWVDGSSVPSGRNLARLCEVLGMQVRDILAHVERNR